VVISQNIGLQESLHIWFPSHGFPVEITV